MKDGFKLEASMQSLNCISGGIRNILKKNIIPIFKISSPKSFFAILFHCSREFNKSVVMEVTVICNAKALLYSLY